MENNLGNQIDFTYEDLQIDIHDYDLLMKAVLEMVINNRVKSSILKDKERRLADLEVQIMKKENEKYETLHADIPVSRANKLISIAVQDENAEKIYLKQMIKELERGISQGVREIEVMRTFIANLRNAF